MARTWIGAWEGGRVRIGKNGEKVWVIESMERGVRYSISLPIQGEPTRVTPDGLLVPPRGIAAELALFNRDPLAYSAANSSRDVIRDVTVGAPSICAELLALFIEDKRSGDDPVSEGHVQDLARHLGNWMVALQGKDLRQVTLAEYRAHLRKLKPRRQHAVALRSFTYWLRQDGRLTSAEDTSRDLAIPQPKPRRAEKVLGFKMQDFEAMYSSILKREDSARSWDPGTLQAVRDVLALRALTGMHHSEIERLARGDWKVRKVDGAGEIAGTVTFIHKKGTPHPQALGTKALAAALRLQKRGKAPEKKSVHAAMDEASLAADLPTMRPGELRHSFVTWARTYGRVVRPAAGGVPVDVIARVVGHTTAKTTSTFYDNTEIPELIVLPLRLENVEDPE